VELALIDTMKGRERTTMRQIQQLCFSYDRESGNYVLQVNRIILAVSLVLVAVFVLFLLLLKRRGGRKTAPAGQEGGGR
jgi:hypothetical protein